MKFIRDLLGKKRKEAAERGPQPVETLEQSYRDTIGSIVEEANALNAEPDVDAMTQPETTSVEPPQEAVPAAPVNIWDLEENASASELPPAAELPEKTSELPPAPAAASAAATRSPARARRTKTRLIGFEKSDGAVVDLFNDAPTPAPAAKSVKFPVGWIVVVDGPGRGESFSLLSGMSQIGRGEDQAIQLDFGDNSISRTNHAAIVYDPESKEFLLGHGGKSNIVRLNDKPVISNETIKTGDLIKIGETILRFVALCDKTFNWADGATEEDEDVAIA
ncbi:FHA domain-containing protein [Yoonia litorea]|uniref:FHA domain-containing protein n=1 Tax=Yoonia litorea TaxID=1123755 RepID=A0A1I6N2P0_9RHOB|nr:FHA domain-containing protein [Yoonia litorea]SFS22219.1 FHA domain-containing protein [Yoonia litorea]